MTKETLIGILEDRAELQLQIGLSDKVYLDGIHLFCGRSVRPENRRLRH